jgi:hypothetical protein
MTRKEIIDLEAGNSRTEEFDSTSFATCDDNDNNIITSKLKDDPAADDNNKNDIKTSKLMRDDHTDDGYSVSGDLSQSTQKPKKKNDTSLNMNATQVCIETICFSF